MTRFETIIRQIDDYLDAVRSAAPNGNDIAAKAHGDYNAMIQSPNSEWAIYYALGVYQSANGAVGWLMDPVAADTLEPISVSLYKFLITLRPSPELDADLRRWQAEHGITKINRESGRAPIEWD